MTFHLQIIGILLVLLGAIHVVFPRMFDWKNQLKALSLINRQMMLVHTFFIALTIFLLGILCFLYPAELVSTELGKAVCIGIGIFFGIRLIIQFIGYSTELWKGKLFKTVAHIFFIALWGYFTAVFFLIGFER